MNRRRLLTALLAATLLSGVGLTAQRAVRDWRDLNRAHQHLQQVINELERARAANNYDMAGHGAKAEQLARQAEHELVLAVESARAGR